MGYEFSKTTEQMAKPKKKVTTFCERIKKARILDWMERNERKYTHSSYRVNGGAILPLDPRQNFEFINVENH